MIGSPGGPGGKGRWLDLHRARQKEQRIASAIHIPTNVVVSRDNMEEIDSDIDYAGRDLDNLMNLPF
jgi:hypothetical protein